MGKTYLYIIDNKIAKLRHGKFYFTGPLKKYEDFEALFLLLMCNYINIAEMRQINNFVKNLLHNIFYTAFIPVQTM